VATKEENIEPLLRSLLALLQHDDADIVTCCAGILSNLTCNNQRNKVRGDRVFVTWYTLCVQQLIVTSGGVERLLTTLDTHMDNVAITEPALCALRHSTSRHEYTEQARNALRIANGAHTAHTHLHQSHLIVGMPIICELLGCGRPPVTKAALGLVQNLAGCAANMASLRYFCTNV
jgi:catenin beta 1